MTTPAEEITEVDAVAVDFHAPLTFDEIAEVERVTRLPFSRWFDGGTPEGALMKAIAWVHARRVDADADFERFGALMVAPR